MYVKRTVLKKFDDIAHIVKPAGDSRGLEDEGLFTEAELHYCNKRLRSLGARFIIKECVLDYLENEMGNVKKNYREIEIINNEFRKPMLRLFGDIRDCVKILKIKDILISISHSRKWVTGMVVFCY